MLLAKTVDGVCFSGPPASAMCCLANSSTVLSDRGSFSPTEQVQLIRRSGGRKNENHNYEYLSAVYQYTYGMPECCNWM